MIILKWEKIYLLCMHLWKNVNFHHSELEQWHTVNIEGGLSTAYYCVVHNFLQFFLNYSTLISTRSKSDPIFYSLQLFFCPYMLFQKTGSCQLLICGSCFLTHMVHFCSVLLGLARSKIQGIGKVGRTQNIMEKWWAFLRYIKHETHSISFFPQGSVTPVSVTLFPVAEALHSRAKQWKPGGDWCLTRYGKWTFYRAWLPALLLGQVCTDFLQLQEGLCILWGGWDALCPQRGGEAGGDNCSVWGWSGWWALLQIATGIDAVFGKRLALWKDQSMGSTQSNL